MAKNIVGLIKLVIPAAGATPAPPVGPALGQKGVNIMDFCKNFNAKTQKMSGPLPVVITVYSDKSYDYKVKTPPASYLILKAAGIEKGSSSAHLVKVGKITRKQLEEIAKVKEPDLTAADLEAAMRIIAGTARSMGITVDEEA